MEDSLLQERKKLLPFLVNLSINLLRIILYQNYVRRDKSMLLNIMVWHPCDTIRDKNILESFTKSPWQEYEI